MLVFCKESGPHGKTGGVSALVVGRSQRGPTADAAGSLVGCYKALPRLTRSCDEICRLGKLGCGN